MKTKVPGVFDCFEEGLRYQLFKMMGSFITRGIIMLLGYVYPAYECFKVVEKNRPNLEHLRFWCQYWIIIAALTVFERLGEIMISWVPMYNEAKLAFIIYLWYPKTLGTSYVYFTFLRPFVVKHESEIDRQLNELTTRAGDLAFFWWHRSSGYIQAQFYQLLAYVASQSNRTQQGTDSRQIPQPSRQPPRPTSQIPHHDGPQGGPQVCPPPPSEGLPESAPGGAGYPPVNVEGPHPPPAAPLIGSGLYPPVAGQAGQGPYPPPPGPHSTGSVYRRRGSGTGTGPANLLSEDSDSDSDSDYDIVEHSAENRPEGRPEGRLESKPLQANPSTGVHDVPLKVYNTRNRLRSSGSR